MVKRHAKRESSKIPDSRRLVEHAQSAIEFLSIYGFAILFITITVVLIYAFLTFTSTTVPTQCSFQGYVTCKAMTIGSNSLTTSAVFLLSNSQQYAIENPSATINITGVGSFGGTCAPNFILPGGILECIITFSQTITAKQISNGNIYLSTTVCTQPTQTGCASPVPQTYGGTFSAPISSLIPPPGCSISLSGVGDRLTANVKISNINVAGVTVDFTSNNPITVSLSPPFSNTDSNGNTVTLASGSAQGNTLITANAIGCTQSLIINTAAPLHYSFTGNAVLSTGGTVSPGSGSYLAGNPVQFSEITNPNYAFNGWTCTGTNCYSGSNSVANIIISSNTVETANFAHLIYLLTESANPPTGGTVSPGSENVMSGNTVSISATSNTGYVFNYWTCSGTNCNSGTSNTASITITSNTVETATFNAIYLFTENAIPSTSGTFSPGSENVISGNTILISATPIGSNVFTHWTCSGTNCNSGTSNTASIVITSNTIETANFQQKIYSFTENAVPSNGGTVSPGSENVIPGNTVPISATPIGSNVFTGWTCSGTNCYSGTNAIANVIITSNTIETANFQQTPPLSCWSVSPYTANDICVTLSGTYYYNGNPETWQTLTSAPPGISAGSSTGNPLSCWNSNVLSTNVCVTTNGFYKLTGGAWVYYASAPTNTVAGSPLSCWSNTGLGADTCITTSGYYEFAGGAWTYYASAPPGTSAGSPLSCANGPFCVTPSGLYFYTSGAWYSYEMPAPTGTAAGSPLSCWWNQIYGAYGCVTPSGFYYWSSSSWNYGASAPTGTSAGSPLSCWYSNNAEDSCVTPISWYSCTSGACPPWWTAANQPAPPGV